MLEMSPALLDDAVLWIHLLSAVFLVGGSFFMWLVVIPVSNKLSKDEAERMRLVERIARRFGAITGVTLVVLVVTGIYNASWYLPSASALFETYTGKLLLAKVLLVVVLIAMVSAHGVYFGRKMARLAREGKLDELNVVRKQSRVLSSLTLVIMLAILLLAVFLQIPP